MAAELERSKASVARLLKERDDLEDKLKALGKELRQAINEKSVQVGERCQTVWQGAAGVFWWHGEDRLCALRCFCAREQNSYRMVAGGALVVGSQGDRKQMLSVSGTGACLLCVCADCRTSS